MTDPIFMTDPIIQARQVEKYYAQSRDARIQVISATDLAIYPGEIVALLGPSGSGKSTLLRMLSGLSQPSAGKVLWHGKDLGTTEVNVSIVFQSFALFPWLTVLENVEAPLKARGMEAHQRHRRSLKILDTVGLDGFEAAYPKELSGGMRQRVGFARALVVEPEVLFMDEPFSSLDVLTAENLRSELLELWHKKTIPTKSIFLVTHNIEEAVLLADRIIVLGRNPGHVRTDFKVQLAQPRDRKAQAFTALVDYIYKVLTRPDVVPTEVPVLADGRRVRDQRQMRYEMLPHARPGGIAGLLELIIDLGGRTDIYRLADELAFEIDDLFPIVEAAQLLGLPEGGGRRRGDHTRGPRVCRVGDPEAEGALPQGGAGSCAATAPDQPGAGEQDRSLRIRGVLPRHAGRAVQRGGVHPPAGDGNQLGPVRRTVRLGRRAAAVHAARP
jgi:NitT/TauT family transport system ATP-binding protein